MAVVLLSLLRILQMSHATSKSRYQSLWKCDLEVSQSAVEISSFQHYYSESSQVFKYIIHKSTQSQPEVMSIMMP